jgi:NADH:ubiquinone reductase (H+-translocating)
MTHLCSAITSKRGKTLADAESVRAKVLKAFETAEIEEDPSKHQDLLTFVLVGAGPTGVEMAGSLAELRRFTLKSDFRRIDPLQARIILAEAAPRILANFPEDLSRKAQARLECRRGSATRAASQGD